MEENTNSICYNCSFIIKRFNKYEYYGIIKLQEILSRKIK